MRRLGRSLDRLAGAGAHWDIYGRVLRGQQWSKTERWTSDAGADLAPQLAASKEGLLLVWQGVRKKNLDILYRYYKGYAWGKEGFVTDNPANDWEPTPTVARDGTFYVAWDSYRGDYDVFCVVCARASGVRRRRWPPAEARKSRHARRGQLRSPVDRLER